MKIKDLVEQLLKLNQEAEIGPPITDSKPNRRMFFYENEGWVEEEIKYCYCGAESCGMEPGFDLCEAHLKDV